LVANFEPVPTFGALHSYIPYACKSLVLAGVTPGARNGGGRAFPVDFLTLYKTTVRVVLDYLSTPFLSFYTNILTRPLFEGQVTLTVYLKESIELGILTGKLNLDYSL
jgi:hypothetical protein